MANSWRSPNALASRGGWTRWWSTPPVVTAAWTRARPCSPPTTSRCNTGSPTGRTVVERFVAERRPRLSADDREMVLGWREVVEGRFEVRRFEGDAVELHNLFDDVVTRLLQHGTRGVRRCGGGCSSSAGLCRSTRRTPPGWSAGTSPRGVRAGPRTRPAAARAPNPHTTPDSDHRTPAGSGERLSLTRCPLLESEIVVWQLRFSSPARAFSFYATLTSPRSSVDQPSRPSDRQQVQGQLRSAQGAAQNPLRARRRGQR